MATRTLHTYQIGDIVKHRGAFLRSAGWYTDVPKNGRVLAVKRLGDSLLLEVEWADGYAGYVNAANVLPAGRPDYS
jgi:hypothetical protein